MTDRALVSISDNRFRVGRDMSPWKGAVKYIVYEDEIVDWSGDLVLSYGFWLARQHAHNIVANGVEHTLHCDQWGIDQTPCTLEEWFAGPADGRGVLLVTDGFCEKRDPVSPFVPLTHQAPMRDISAECYDSEEEKVANLPHQDRESAAAVGEKFFSVYYLLDGYSADDYEGTNLEIVGSSACSSGSWTYLYPTMPSGWNNRGESVEQDDPSSGAFLDPNCNKGALYDYTYYNDGDDGRILLTPFLSNCGACNWTGPGCSDLNMDWISTCYASLADDVSSMRYGKY